MRDSLERVRRLRESGGEGEAALAFTRMQQRGPRFAREDAETLLRVHPLIARDTFLTLAKLVSTALDGFETVARLRLDRLSHTERDAVVAFDALVWGIGNLVVIAGPKDPRTIDPSFPEEVARAPLLYSALTARWSTFAHVLRATWVAARLGKPGLAELKAARRQPSSRMSRLWIELAIGGIACASPKLRTEARKALGAPGLGDDDYERAIDRWMAAFAPAIESVLDAPEEGDAHIVEFGRRFAAGMLMHTGGPTDEQMAAVPEDVARAVLSTLAASTLDGEASLGHFRMVWALPWLARARPEELFLPLAWTNHVVLPGRELVVIEGWLGPLIKEGGARRTPTIRRAGPSLGRNDPCSCGSGQKYKRCCARR